MTKHVLVTGGAGYIGSHACKVLAAKGYVPVTYDNLSTGWAQAVKFGPLVQGDLMDRTALDAAFEHYKPVAVMHFAAFSQVGEAMSDPGKYWRNNVLGSLSLAEAAVAHGVLDFVFSSTCATYGEQDGVLLTEDCAQEPINAYGSSKRAVEEILRDFRAAHDLRTVIFRYFNVAGADPEAEIGECHRPETHLIPVMLEAIDGQRPELVIHGDDYDTHDGTCVRDYVHVMDLVEAHVLGLEWLLDGKGSRVFNLGTGAGFTVKEVIGHARAATGHKVPHRYGPRRGGDATSLVSGSHAALTDLGWDPARSSLKTMIKDAWTWHKTGGYPG
ncbi:UDP-glucose 4-epimerase GalE [Rhodobacter sp. NTK016B]|uniref:UDP-glucose 4-epimerase GalE n=1 Tax=Rhodobacter sp. NTK016B TaxID=2759676 RepID=UPI001A8F5A7B|nr:UDP-glucose 4-epimerase GalE [Rhodobacter sp. NTK016B]MBN8294860.1 UDP-glucose 4-epimerase GalE [Rhodobacter sp. NTK016B]